MAAFDTVIDKHYSDNFKGYTGNPPTSKEEYDVLDCWKDTSKAPSWDDISSKISIENVRDKRAREYPHIAEQLDMLYWDKINGTNNWQTAIQSVKDKYPKG